MSRSAGLAIILALLPLLPALGPHGALAAPAALAQPAPAADNPLDTAATHPTPAPSHKVTDYTGFVIPPGQEELLADMLGRGAQLPGPCEFASGGVDGPIVRSTYTCPAGEVVFELCHPSKAPGGATQTARFAIILKSGSPPDGLADALTSLIRSRETAFEWKWIAPPTPSGSSLAQSSTTTGLLAAAGLLGCAALGWVLYRRRRPATKA